MASCLLSTLPDDPRDCALQLRLLHAWKSGDPSVPDQFFAFSTLWVDASGTFIEGISHRSFAEALSGCLSIGSLYVIREFAMCDPQASFRACNFHRCLVITPATKLEDVTASSIGFTTKSFQKGGEVNGSSTSSTRVVVNPLIHEADAIKLRYTTEVGSARYIVFDTEDKIRQYLYNSFRTIEELHQILASDYNPDQRFWCAPIRVFDALVDIENDKKDFLVQKGFGKFFGVVLDEFDKYMGSWINNQYNTTDHTLTLPNGTVHHVVEDDFELVYGLPRGDTEVPSPTMKTDPGSLFPATLYELGDAVKRTRDVETWFKLFFVFLINSLCIGSSHDVERKFGHLVSNEMLLRFNNFNWCKYFLQLFKYTIAFEPKGNRRADYYFLVVLYLVKSNKTNNSDCLLSGFLVML
ncbi:unnamed protein product [Linum tenue]|uniref:Uncharacterized protein n=1 Tax=Linum tenue TaxID=586396 RepID=A0AAV0IE01_9ROSI|nr:unnamed protein product [Linum tenue]